MEAPELDVDLWDHDMFQRQGHHRALEALRETDPGIHWIDEGDMGPGYWAITRHAHLKEVKPHPRGVLVQPQRHPDVRA